MINVLLNNTQYKVRSRLKVMELTPVVGGNPGNTLRIEKQIFKSLCEKGRVTKEAVT